MDTTVPPAKKRRTRKDRPLLESDPGAAEAVSIETVKISGRPGQTVKKVTVPIFPEETRVAPDSQRIQPELNDNLFSEYNMDVDQDEPQHLPKPNMVCY